MIEFIWIAYGALGLIAGLIAGMLGIGSGVIIVPALLMLFEWQALDGPLMQMATSTSLATMTIITTSAAFAHWKKDSVVVPIWRWIILGNLIGIIIGAVIADSLHSDFLKQLFGVFLIFSGLKQILAKPTAASSHHDLYPPYILVAFGVLTASLSALLGIGGGILLVPFFLSQSLSMPKAAGTALACTMVMAYWGAAVTIFTGLNAPDLPDHTIGYMLWPAALTIGIASLFTTRIGVKLAHHLPTALLKRLFGGLLLLIACKMLLW